ncbi:MAG: porin family protein [Chitinophagaceae bacterium]
MKRTIVAICLLATVGVHAQNISGGVKAGANISNFTGGNISDLENKALFGFHAGGFLNFSLGAVAIQPELLVSTAGAKFEDADTDFKLTYISLPVMVQFKPGGGFYLEVGPQVSFKISEDVGESTVEDFAKDLDLAAAAGLGYNFGKIGIGARYLAGLSKVGDFDSGDIDPDFKNSTIQVGLTLRLGK